MKFSLEKCKRSLTDFVVGDIINDKTYYIEGLAVKILSNPLGEFAQIYRYDDCHEKWCFYGEAYPDCRLTEYIDRRRSIAVMIINRKFLRDW